MGKDSSRLKTFALLLVAAFMAALCFSSCCPYMYHRGYHGRGGSYYDRGYDHGYGYHDDHHRHRHWGS